MDIVEVIEKLSKVAKLKKVKENEYEIITDAKIDSKTPIKIFLRKTDAGLVMCDNKHTLKYMNNIYELKSLDVKGCIASVIKIYGFSILSGELIANLINTKTIMETFYNYIICVGQLANMYAFFDKP